jgi:hypothetical protein
MDDHRGVQEPTCRWTGCADHGSPAPRGAKNLSVFASVVQFQYQATEISLEGSATPMARPGRSANPCELAAPRRGPPQLGFSLPHSDNPNPAHYSVFLRASMSWTCSSWSDPRCPPLRLLIKILPAALLVFAACPPFSPSCDGLHCWRCDAGRLLLLAPSRRNASYCSSSLIWVRGPWP